MNNYHSALQRPVAKKNLQSSATKKATGFGGFDFSSLLKKATENLQTAGQKSAEKYIAQNTDKYINIGITAADSLVNKYVTPDAASAAEARARLQSLGQAAVKGAQQEASGSIASIIKDNKWIIIGGGLGVLVLFMGTIAISSSAGSRKYAGNPRRKAGKGRSAWAHKFKKRTSESATPIKANKRKRGQ